ncbi:transcriptional repressor LexA [Papillibacter cinnamivorans]|uniref:Repressor LexA n=1 Tax=Papillibacter cinnamivorans DSM 12816 TaxID=1122930 RepID=A0A1W2AMT0_9FIRM|nr:transcriptional repressor LexA [Papillibacter cinnamivorans]SMC61822.1 repressor LexA [Papillibacter cinnamivorans DSM 12816]
MRSKSTELMSQIREYIERYFDRYSSTPTVREIAGAMHIATSSAHRYLVTMAKRTMISYENGILSTAKIEMMTPQVNHAAIVGSIPCGTPEEKEAQIEEYIPLSVSVFGSGSFYVLRASGDSMIEAQIDDGDLVIIREQEKANLGDIVVALTNEEKNTLKRLCYDNDKESYYLHPENKELDDIYVKELRVQGIATHVIKAL